MKHVKVVSNTELNSDIFQKTENIPSKFNNVFIA